MNQGPNPPSGNPGGKGRRRRRGRRGSAAHGAAQQQGKQHNQGQGQPHGQSHQHGQHQGQQKHQGGRRFGKKHSGRKSGGRPGQMEPLGGVYSAPMDHSYRAVLGEPNGNLHKPERGRNNQGFGRQLGPVDLEPLAVASDAPARIYAFVDDLFFLAKIQETARKLNVKVEFVKTDKDVFERMGQNGNDKPSLIIVDLNTLSGKPLSMIPKLKNKLKKETNIIGFVSHVQGELKMKALEAGCDMVVPRSAFSQNLPQLLRRHAVQEEELPEPQQPN
jgi:ActR/RegA family two-component response regulator